jgi:hypothetical protein
MPFDPNNPNAWINQITDGQPEFVGSLCRSLYHEPLLACWPQGDKLCHWGMTGQGRVAVVDENDPEWTLRNTPAPERMLAARDARYDALVRQQEAPEPWDYAVAAFKYTGGNFPASSGADAWRLVHLYEALTVFGAGNRDEAARAARHFTQAAALVAVHPVVFHLKREHPCVVTVLQRVAFRRFHYDPTNQFAESAPCICGFVAENPNQETAKTMQNDEPLTTDPPWIDPDPDPDAVDLETIKRDYLAYIFPIDLLKASLETSGFRDVRHQIVEKEREIFQLVMIAVNEDMTVPVVRRLIGQIIDQIPPFCGVAWRLEPSPVEIVNQNTILVTLVVKPFKKTN